ncbi:hypothetical protein BaRGS_00035000 [Batillaria attramentaria]|uniref:Ig-like domain-containing protein n=1 Tax=Batillaria attramentaria TaxID=370345 RepID=A0ABD0JHA6_9CAEN
MIFPHRSRDSNRTTAPRSVSAKKILFVKTLEDKSVKKGEKVVLTVKAEGVPPTELTWYHNGSSLGLAPENDEYDFSTLTIRHVTAKHSGVYSCAREGTNGSTKCLVNVDAGTEPIQTEWLHENKRLQDKAPVKLCENSRARLCRILVISQVTKENEGLYTLKVKNDYGEDSIMINVTVEDVFTQKLQDTTVGENQEVTPTVTTSECPECRKHQKVTNNTVKVLPVTLDSMKKNTRDGKVAQCKKMFLQYINSFMNGSGGQLIIHASDPHVLGKFDMKIDDRLKSLIPDGQFFHDVFERYLKDNNHVCFRVKIGSRSRQWSTMDFCTHTSLNKGRDDLNHTQLKEWIKSVTQPPAAEKGPEVPRHETETPVFRKGDKVYLGMSETRLSVPFLESYSRQAKGTQVAKEPGDDSGVDLAKRHWEKKGNKLPHYITGFCKIPGGGSYFIGIGEQSSTFTCQGHKLPPEEREHFKQFIRDKVRTEMLWYGTKEELNDPVEIIFHPVEGSEDAHLCVIEVKTRHFRGLAFNTKEGPLMYKLPEHSFSAHIEDGDASEDSDDDGDTQEGDLAKVSAKKWIQYHSAQWSTQNDRPAQNPNPLIKCEVQFTN